jgi:uncharacterized protein (TIGR03437 family)
MYNLRSVLKAVPLVTIALAVTAMAQAQPVVSSVVNYSSLQDSLSPGADAIIFGTNLAPTGVQDLSITLAGVPCGILISSDSQIDVELPVNAATGPSNLVVSYTGAASTPFPVTLNAYAPALSTASGTGSGIGAFTDGANVVSASSPAHVGDTITAYGVGLGATNPVVATGVLSPSNPLAVTLAQPTVTVGGIAATVTFSGLAPGYIGLYQVNFTVPLNAPIGDQNVILTIGGIASPVVILPVAAGNPASLTISGGTPQTGSLDTQFALPLSVSVADAESNPVTGATVTFTAPALSGPSVTFANGVNTAVTNSSGVASLAAFANGSTGTFNVTAAVAGLASQATFALTNQFPVTAPYTLSTSVTPAGGGTVTPASGQNFASDAIVQITATPAAGYTFTSWSGAVADPYASTTTVTMTAAQLVVANFIHQVFTDVPPSEYYFDAVNLLSQEGITSGCTPSTYCPTDDVLRSQMAVFIIRGIEGSSATFTYSATPYFADVPSGSFGFEYIQKMYELGITAGCGPAPGGGLNYCPNDNVTRSQMAIFMIRARYGTNTQFDFPTTPYFTDVPVGAFGFDWIQRMKEDNITSGCTATTYCPNNAVTRGDMAIFVMRGLFNRLLPAAQPVLFAVSANAIGIGNSVTVTVTGANTHFVQGTTVVSPMVGFTVGAVTVLSPTSLTVTLTPGSSVTPQPESIWVITGTEEAVLPNAVAAVVPTA